MSISESKWIDRTMNESKCHGCLKSLSPKDRTYRRVCCDVLFHLECVRPHHMAVCPSCWNRDNHKLIWVPTCVVEDDDDDDDDDDDSEGNGPPAKRRKIDVDECVICLERGTEKNRVLTTECCGQKGHASCIRTYYELPAKCPSKYDRARIATRLGIPNCFVCRADPLNIVPLDRRILEAILPEVEKKPRFPDADYANRALVAWDQLTEVVLEKLTLNQSYRYSLDAGTVEVRYENGAVERGQFEEIEDGKSCASFRKSLRRQLTRMVYRWAGLPPEARAFDEDTCHRFVLREIDEMVLHLTISQHYKRAKRSTRPDAPPFAVEYELAKISTWICKGHYFDFEHVSYDAIDERNPPSVRLSRWNYDFDEPKP